MTFLTGIFARVLFAIPLLVLGLNHFLATEQMRGIVPGFLPASTFWIYLTGGCLIAAGLAIITRARARLAALLLAVLLGIFVIAVHLPALFNEEMRQMAKVALLKDTSLAAAALFLAGILGEKKN